MPVLVAFIVIAVGIVSSIVAATKAVDADDQPRDAAIVAFFGGGVLSCAAMLFLLWRIGHVVFATLL
jgi:hypothetical protein